MIERLWCVGGGITRTFYCLLAGCRPVDEDRGIDVSRAILAFCFITAVVLRHYSPAALSERVCAAKHSYENASHTDFLLAVHWPLLAGTFIPRFSLCTRASRRAIPTGV